MKRLPKGLRRCAEFISALLGAVVLFSLLAIVAYFVVAFIYFGGTGGFDGLVTLMITHVPVLAKLPMHTGPIDWSDYRSVCYHALRTFGPGLFVFAPSYLILRLWEAIVPS